MNEKQNDAIKKLEDRLSMDEIYGSNGTAHKVIVLLMKRVMMLEDAVYEQKGEEE